MQSQPTPQRPVRTLVAGAPRPAVPELAVVPGLGALGYLLPAVRACAAWTRVHLLDVPGFGDRRTARLPADLASIAQTLRAWLEQAAPVVLVGHSTGAQAALRVAASDPHLVRGVVLAGVTFPPQARRPLPLLARVLRTLPHERPGELPAVLPYYLRGAARLPELLRTALADRPEDVVRAVSVPLLVLRGRHDHLCPQPWAEQLAARGALAVVPGGHNAPYTQPVATSEALRRWTEALPAGAPGG